MTENATDQWVNIKELAAKYAGKLEPGVFQLRRILAQDRLVGQLVAAFLEGKVSGFADEGMVRSYQRKEFGISRYEVAGRLIVNAAEIVSFSKTLWRETDSRGISAAFNGMTKQGVFEKAVAECQKHDGAMLRDRCTKFQHWGFHATLKS